ncbi:coiled-coil domain-containing protein 180 [Epinephelus moara]|uniref:coiled-coil domain-containing protein 180 n=1 Tax=Epinephelus moara TaxID=300413 RepID=UPI00214E401D|nr:coiled-coil domain-containing protein 180 [Epinephelus moara]
MCESRAVPSGKVYRQLFDAQVQLSRSLLAGRKDTRTDCLSAEDSVTHCSTTSRLLCPPSSRGQQVDDDDDDIDDVSRLPDSVVVDQPSSDIIERLTERKNKKHKEALKQLKTELTHLSQECESQARTISVELLSSLQDVDLRLNNLKDRMEHLDHLSVQEVCVLWEEVEEEVKMKKIRIMELNHKLTESETQRAAEIKVVLRTFLHLLQKINFLSPPDVCTLVHAEATMLNQSLLANRRSVARLLLLLQEENLQQESLLRLHWEDCLSRWRRSRVTEVIDRFRRLCCSDEEQQLDSGQLVSGQLVSGQLVSGQLVMRDLTGQRDDIISKISSLVPPSTALVSDWSNQLTAVNQQIDSLHTDFLHQLRCCYEQKWQDRLAEVERCKEALSALQLAEEEVNNIVSSQLLILIGQHQRQDEERLAALDLCCDSVARHAFNISRCVFVVMQGAALQWETHNHRLERKKEDLQQHLDDLRHTQQQHIQRKKVRLDDLLRRLRQEGSEEALKRSLDKTVHYLQDVKSSCGQCVSDQWEVLHRLPSVLLEELLSYSSSLSSFFHLDHTYKPSPEELQKLHPSSALSTQSETSGGAETQKPEETTQSRPIRCQNDTDPAQPSQDRLTEAESSLLDLCDTSSDVTFTSPSGVTYSGPTFRCPTLNLQQKTHLSLFPVELLTDNLNRMRTLFFDHLEQRFHDVLSWGVATVTDRKEVVRLEQEVQLQQLNPEHIENHIYQQRLAELQLHRQQVDTHCEEVSAVLESCREELRELQTSVSRRNQEFTVSLSNMEEDDQSADSRQRLEAVSSALQDCLDQHIKDTQQIQTYFTWSVQLRLQEVRNKTTHLLTSFRLFSEGGDFAPQEVKQFQRRLKEETRQMRVTEESIFSELELFESQSLQQVKEASRRMEEKLSLLRSELEFTEEIQKISSSTRVQIKAQNSSVSTVTVQVEKEWSRRQESNQENAVVVTSQSPTVPHVQQRGTESVNTLSVKRSCRSARSNRRFQVFGAEPEKNPHSLSSTLNSVLWKASDVLLQVAKFGPMG